MNMFCVFAFSDLLFLFCVDPRKHLHSTLQPSSFTLSWRHVHTRICTELHFPQCTFCLQTWTPWTTTPTRHIRWLLPKSCTVCLALCIHLISVCGVSGFDPSVLPGFWIFALIFDTQFAHCLTHFLYSVFYFCLVMWICSHLAGFFFCFVF